MSQRFRRLRILPTSKPIPVSVSNNFMPIRHLHLLTQTFSVLQDRLQLRQLECFVSGTNTGNKNLPTTSPTS